MNPPGEPPDPETRRSPAFPQASRSLRSAAAAGLLLGVLAGCPAPRAPGSGASVGARTLELGRANHVLAGVAGRGATVFASLSAAQPKASTTIEAYAPGAAAAQPTWRAELDGFGGPLVVSGPLVVAALGGSATVAGMAVRGEPGAAVAALDAATGARTWALPVDATEWATVAALAALPDGVVVVGSFAGTLRIADKVVSSAGRSDGFLARVTAAGAISWLVRLGGPGADQVAAVATSGDRVAIAGTFTAGAELLGQPLPAFDDRSSHADGFVAELDARGDLRWVQMFGGKAEDTVAGIAIDVRGHIAVAATVRDTVHVGGADIVASGAADGLVAWWLPGGGHGPAIVLGGADYDGLRAITAAGDHVVVAGFYSGSLRLGDRALTAAGGDDAFVAALDTTGAVVSAWPISGEGREEVTALAAIPGGFVAGVAHTAAARIGDTTVSSPSDPMTGAAVAVRSLP